MSAINSYPVSTALAAETQPQRYSTNRTSGQYAAAENSPFEAAVAEAISTPGTERGSASSNLAVGPGGAATDGPSMMPMQQSWVAPVVPATTSEYPLHPIFRVPMVSEATLNRYIHPLQAVGTVAPGSTEAEGDLGTSVFRVAPGGRQDFVTEDGYRHRFDVEIVFPSPSTFTWQDRDASEIHPEVGDFAAKALREQLEGAGMDVAKLEITPFRMKGGNEARPWFLDQLVLKMEGKEDLAISLNVAMRDPGYTLETIQTSWESKASAPYAIPS